MSEYQYYEFQAIDKPLSEKDMESLRDLSSRAQITPTSFVNEYNYGDFRGSPLKLMEKYFDAFLYVANWGTRWLMLRIPKKLIDIDMARQYCIGDSATIHEKGEYLIFEFTSETEYSEWEEGEGWLSSLISLRSDILHGDYRCLYLAWLFCAQMDEFEEEENEVEPPVPANLGELNAPLNSFVNFMRINTDLLSVASKNSVSKDPQTQNQKPLKSWIRNLPAKDKDDIVLRLIKDHDPHLGTELMQRFRKDVSVDNVTGKKRRTLEALLEKAAADTAERKRKNAEQKAKEHARKKREEAIAREKYLNDLAQREDTIWKAVESLIQTKRPSDYDEAVTLLVDLRDLNKKKNKEIIFEEKFRSIYEKHSRKPSFVRRLIEAGLDG